MHATNQDIKVDKRIGNWVKIGLSLDSYFLFLFFFLIRFRATFQLLFYAVAMLGTTWWKIILKSNLTLSRQRNSERKRRKKNIFLPGSIAGLRKGDGEGSLFAKWTDYSKRENKLLIFSSTSVGISYSRLLLPVKVINIFAVYPS